ncbi:MAG: PadR family transcriptional regulator [Candidatus Latescibacteria bacterium]|nr:PadR family transcriptional regulator [Candidatus Latescibacterota bacterium]MDP7237308.1 PadR family transcriptional regulator [Candidatus Latescibacterota bacterium]
MRRPVYPFNEMPGDLVEAEEIFEKLRLELRRGAIVLAVLAQLRKEHYGYSLRKALISLGIEIDEGTLYPLVRRLEKQGLLWSEWREEDKRQKRFYRISEIGEDVLNRLTKEWSHLNSRISTMLEEDES